MSKSANTYIAGSKTERDWLAFRSVLADGANASTWEIAFEDYFRTRLMLRYLEPIRVLQESGSHQGEGFSIVAIQCTLIEFLESTAQGLQYRYLRKGEKLGPNEYSSSSAMFTAFLCGRKPFSNTFDETSARDFYVNVRCGLLHEAQTKGGWKVWAASQDGTIADVTEQIVYRDNFHGALLEYIDLYKTSLMSDEALQSAFVRKFDGLCAAPL